jgi:hypothetical protein
MLLTILLALKSAAIGPKAKALWSLARRVKSPLLSEFLFSFLSFPLTIFQLSFSPSPLS